jgi:hypothetical protein
MAVGCPTEEDHLLDVLGYGDAPAHVSPAAPPGATIVPCP